jgi:outer membrane lipoprotein-sorting protein
MKKTILALTLIGAFATSNAEDMTADKIVNGYIENTGGTEAWNNLTGVKLIGEMNQGGMKFPFEIVQLKDGHQYMKFNFQGKELKQGVFDGENMWNTNFMSMKAEKADAESTANQKLEMNDFPFPLFHYKENGYQLELLGKEEKGGSQAYKLKLTREPKFVDGKQVEDISYYYFDEDALVPLVTESEVKEGPMKGKMGESKLSDYQEVEGLYFPFSMTQGLKDGPGATMVISKIVLNPTVDANEFLMPKEEPAPESPKESDKSK